MLSFICLLYFYRNRNWNEETSNLLFTLLLSESIVINEIKLICLTALTAVVVLHPSFNISKRTFFSYLVILLFEDDYTVCYLFIPAYNLL